MFKRITRYLDLSADAIINPEKEQSDSTYDEIAHIFDLCNARQRQIIIALAKTILDMPELTE